MTMKKWLGAVTLGVISFALVFAVACGSNAENPPPTPKPDTSTVEILPGAVAYDNDPNNDFSPNTLTITVGTTVKWVNNDDTVHTVTADDGSFDSGFFNKGETWSHTFNKPGEYSYHCRPHPWMTGKIVVVSHDSH